MNVFERVGTWNQIRDNMQFRATKEFNMMESELDEYLNAESMENRAKELADIIFVASGALCKYTGSWQKAEEIFKIVCNHNDAKGLEKDKNGKIKKVKQKSCEPKIRKVLEQKVIKQGNLFENC